MIRISYDITTHTAKLVQTATTIKAGGSEDVELLFSGDPGVVTGLHLALGNKSGVHAETDSFFAENPRKWTADLDTTDTRLKDFLDGQDAESAPLSLELVALIDGERKVTPNLAVTVQRAIITGPSSTEPGVTYFTAAQVTAAIAAAVAGAVGTVRQGTIAIPAGQSYVSVPIAGGGFSDTGWFLESAMVINNVDPTPDNISTGIQTAVTATTFVQHFGGKAPTANYSFKYVCKKY